jgi:hypothetical protein
MPGWRLMVDVCGDEIEPLGCMVEWLCIWLRNRNLYKLDAVITSFVHKVLRLRL